MRRFFTTLLFVFSLTTVFGQSTHKSLEIFHLTGDFYVYITYQSYQGTPFPANGLYLVTKEGIVMIDTPWDITQIDPLLDSIKMKHHKNVVMCIATHSHEDRTGGLDLLRKKGIKTYTTKQTDAICIENNQKRAEFLIEKDTTFKVGEHSFQTYYAGQGHTPDNIVVWFGKEKVLYGGCLIKSTEATTLGNLADANAKAWPATIKNLQQKFGEPNYVIPGHQSWANKKSLAHTLKLIQQYEAKK